MQLTFNILFHIFTVLPSASYPKNSTQQIKKALSCPCGKVPGVNFFNVQCDYLSLRIFISYYQPQCVLCFYECQARQSHEMQRENFLPRFLCSFASSGLKELNVRTEIKKKLQ